MQSDKKAPSAEPADAKHKPVRTPADSNTMREESADYEDHRVAAREEEKSERIERLLTELMRD